MSKKKITYGQAIREGFQYLLANYPEVCVIGQGLWSPWYVGSSMTDLEKEFGKNRIIDTPVSELGSTGMAIGAAIAGQRPIVVHPRMDFMYLAMDTIVNQAAKWSYMFAGQSQAPVTIRGIINRGGEQGAQHSQAVHNLYAHIPGLRVVMPATVADARDLLISSVLCNDPVIYIDDRWLYELEDTLEPVDEIVLANVGPKVCKQGKELTIVASGYSVQLALQAADVMEQKGSAIEVIDLRVINPLKLDVVFESVKKTGGLLVLDGGWQNCGLAGEIIASVATELNPEEWKVKPRRLTLPDTPAPTSCVLENLYYPNIELIFAIIQKMLLIK